MDPITPPRLNLARLPTPLVPLRRFSEKHEVPTIWMKRDDLTDTAASGNKLRKLEFSVAQALQEGATTLITSGAVQSNHCRATAIVASQLGFALI
jgi:D-cysteine desulfhydrase